MPTSIQALKREVLRARRHDLIRPSGAASMALRGVVVQVEKVGHDGGRPYEIGVRLLGEFADALTVLRRTGAAPA
jgi:hypothetical protein